MVRNGKAWRGWARQARLGEAGRGKAGQGEARQDWTGEEAKEQKQFKETEMKFVWALGFKTLLALVVYLLMSGYYKADTRVTLVAPADKRADAQVIDLVWFDATPTDKEIVSTLLTRGAISYKLEPDKSACDDTLDCARAARDTCRAIGKKVKKQAYEISQGCTWTCMDGTTGTASCVVGR